MRVTHDKCIVPDHPRNPLEGAISVLTAPGDEDKKRTCACHPNIYSHHEIWWTGSHFFDWYGIRTALDKAKTPPLADTGQSRMSREPSMAHSNWSQGSAS
jgi:hypothetical protein